MSGPTGVRGSQGPRGLIGVEGPNGITGMFGPQGGEGPVGVAGGTGITGSTGIQLDGNGSLIQCASVINVQVTTGSTSSIITFNTFNPVLSASLSTSISGQYDATGMNYYGNPLSAISETLNFPAGNYLIRAILQYNTTSSGTIALRMTNPSDDVIIASSTTASPGSDCILHTFFTPTQTTSAVFRVFASQNPQPVLQDGIVTSISPQRANISIVKIW